LVQSKGPADRIDGAFDETLMKRRSLPTRYASFTTAESTAAKLSRGCCRPKV
jgi:hypothetical protein